MEGFSLRAEYCCCCVSSDGQGSPGSCTEAPAAVRLVEARPKRQRGAVKAAAPGGGRPPLAAKSGVPASSKVPEATAGAGGSKPAKAVPPSSGVAEVAKAARALPLSGKRVADFAPILVWTTISVVSRWLYLFIYLFLIYSLVRRRVGRRPTCYGCACRGDHDGCRSAEGEGRGSQRRRRGVGPRGCHG
jgi:hypothetical protein